MKHRTIQLALLLSLFAASRISAQLTPMEQKYISVEVGANYSSIIGDGFYLPYFYPYFDASLEQPVDRLPLDNAGSGFGWLLGGTFDYPINATFALVGKIRYRNHSTTSTQVTEPTNIIWDVSFANNTAQVNAKNENHLSTRVVYLGVDALLRYQLGHSNWYGIAGLSYSGYLSDRIELYRMILGDGNGTLSFPNYPDQSPSGVSRIEFAEQASNQYFNGMQFHFKVGAGTLIPLGNNGLVLAPEIALGLPLGAWVSSTFAAHYEVNRADVPTMLYTEFTMGIKFPLGSSSESKNVEQKPIAVPTEVRRRVAETPIPSELSVRGQVTDVETGAPIQAQITVTDLESNRTLKGKRSDINGKYEVGLDYGKYSITASAEGYMFSSIPIEVSSFYRTADSSNIRLRRLKNGSNIKLLVYFDFDKAVLLASSYPELDRLVKFMQDNPAINAEVAGYTDSVGTEGYNLLLSEQRAIAVQDYLIGKSIGPARLRAKGYGELTPISTNATEVGRADNRRVEFIVKN